MEESSSKAMRKQPLTWEVPNWKIARTSGGQWLCPFVLVLFLQPFRKKLLLTAARWRLLGLRNLYFNPVCPFPCSYGIGYVMDFHQSRVFLLYLLVNIGAFLWKLLCMVQKTRIGCCCCHDMTISFKNKFFLALFSTWHLDILCWSLSSKGLIRS